ncbi:MAG: extracellular solute-binding protein [Treponema sp.]|nr:extracellular solute-binding protein [Treponema sp.]
MSKKKIMIACLVLASMFFSAAVFAQRVPDAPNAVRTTIRGMNITIGTWWFDYNTTRTPPTNQWTGSDYQERQLDYRKRLLAQYSFSMVERNIASWNEMSQVAATSIMAGRPAATVFRLQPDWAMALYRQNLLYPVGNRSRQAGVNWTATTPVEWNRSVTEAFTFNNRTFAFADGYGGSQHAAVVFWNKRLFREAGLDPNLPYDLQRNGQWTWDRFLQICRQLTRDTRNRGVIDTFAMPADLSTEILDALISSNGANYVGRDRSGRLFNATNTPAFIEAVNFYMRLRDAGVMKPKPDGAAWNWHIPEFNDGRVAMRIDQQYLATNDLRNMRDDWGMVLPPKGPRAPGNNYVVFNDENVMVIPARGFTDAQVDAILWAVQAWVTPIDENWRLEHYSFYRDRRAVDETIALIRDQRLWQWKYHLHVPGLQRGNIAWQIWGHDGEPAQLIEAVSQTWNALIADANTR